MLAARERRHLNFASSARSLPAGERTLWASFGAMVSVAVAAGLFWASLRFVWSEIASPVHIGGWLPIWVAATILPFSFAAMTIRFVLQAGGWRQRAIAALGIPGAVAIGWAIGALDSGFAWAVLAGLVVSALLGAPIFVLIGGAALVLFMADGVPVAALTVEAYRLVASPSIPAIPLFTMAGYLLASGGASERLVNLFRALFGWLPGGPVFAVTLVCTFFTTFTGASGVTILALGGLLLPLMLRAGYSERFSVGLLTSTGSIGLLFPPSLAVILYGVVAHVSILELFRASAVPGLLMVGAVCALGLVHTVRAKIRRTPFDPRAALAALWWAKWEVLLPVLLLVCLFAGFTTLIEAAAVIVVYILFVETVVHRDLNLARDLPRTLVQCGTMLGGVFVILAVAMGFTNYLVDAEVPMRAAAWVEANVHSRLVFLLALNIFLLIVGCLMDIFSAIVVVVPLIVPISQVFGIHPLHLGVIFLVNLELGYLTPPVGMNLFLAAYRFDKPLLHVCRAALPFLLALVGVVLLVTYGPLVLAGVMGH